MQFRKTSPYGFLDSKSKKRSSRFIKYSVNVKLNIFVQVKKILSEK